MSWFEHRDDANKFNVAIDDENIDFNILRRAERDGKTITWHLTFTT